MPTIPIVKPAGPMSLADVDAHLTTNARLLASAEGDARWVLLLESDRLLDVRLAIMRDGEA